MTNEQLTVIRRPEALEVFGCSKSTLQNRINDGLIPPPISLGGRAVGFVLQEMQTVLKAMVAGKSHQEIQKLVSELIEQRKQLV